MIKRTLGLISLVLISFFAQAQNTSPLKVNDIPLDFDLLSFSLLPNDSAFIETTDGSTFQITNENGIDISVSNMYWKADGGSGIYSIHIENNSKSYKVNFIVMDTFEEIKNTPNDFTIGTYPAKAYKNLAQYEAPKGMIKVTKENQDTFLTQHFQLKDFLVKQGSGYPKYVLVSPKLLYKLELIIAKLKEQDYHVGNMHIMSGYRTPYYNAKIGNGKSSRHIYGDAADIFLDNDNNQAMDDLNKDGKISIHDAQILGKIIENIDKDAQYKWLIGGLGIYNGNGAHRGFVHVDTRGYKARW